MNKNNQTKQKKQDQQSPILNFQGYYTFLSNDYPCWVYHQGILYPSVTTAFQASRTPDVSIRAQISKIEDIKQFTQICLKIKNPQNWKQCRYKIMQMLIRDKFKRNKQLANKLIGTKNRKLVNTMRNVKNDGVNESYWGVVNNRGKNVIGNILMDVRKEFVNGVQTKNWIESGFRLERNQRMWPIVNLLVTKKEKKIDKLFLEKKSYFIFGSLKTSDFFLQNPTISRSHACILFNSDIQAILIDLNSTHGTFLIDPTSNNKKTRLQSLIPYTLELGNIIQFGTSDRMYTVEEFSRANVQQYIKQTQQELNKQLEQVRQTNQLVAQYQQNEGEREREMVQEVVGEKNCLQVENIEDVSYHKLKLRFQQYGTITKIRTQIDQKTGKSQGTALIFYKDASSASLAIKNQNKYKVTAITTKIAQKILKSNYQNSHQPRDRSRSREKKHNRKY